MKMNPESLVTKLLKLGAIANSRLVDMNGIILQVHGRTISFDMFVTLLVQYDLLEEFIEWVKVSFASKDLEHFISKIEKIQTERFITHSFDIIQKFKEELKCDGVKELLDCLQIHVTKETGFGYHFDNGFISFNAAHWRIETIRGKGVEEFFRAYVNSLTEGAELGMFIPSPDVINGVTDYVNATDDVNISKRTLYIIAGCIQYLKHSDCWDDNNFMRLVHGCSFYEEWGGLKYMIEFIGTIQYKLVSKDRRQKA